MQVLEQNIFWHKNYLKQHWLDRRHGSLSCFFFILFSESAEPSSKSSVTEPSESSKWGASTKVEILILVVLLAIAA